MGIDGVSSTVKKPSTFTWLKEKAKDGIKAFQGATDFTNGLVATNDVLRSTNSANRDPVTGGMPNKPETDELSQLR